MDLPLVGRISWLNIPTDEAHCQIQARPPLPPRLRSGHGSGTLGMTSCLAIVRKRVEDWCRERLAPVNLDIFLVRSVGVVG